MASTPPRASNKKGVEQNGTPSSLKYPAEVSDDVNMNQLDGPVTLDVTLPNGQRTEICVDYNTPMLDLLVSVAGQCKLNPSGLTLQLLAEDTGKPLAYKPNQTIGGLGGRMVHILTKDEISGKSKNRTANQDKPFEVTHRFTINLPRGQKTVQRVSPAMTLGELVAFVCQDKGLDQRRHVLQIPGKPGVLVDPSTTIQQVGVYEMNLINVGPGLEDRNHTVSMPDLSQPVPKEDRLSPLSPPATEQKKKRGFLSFLSKKDKKYKPEVRLNSETSSNSGPTLNSTPARQPLTPPSQRRASDLQRDATRPKSMFVMASPLGDDNASNTSKDGNQVALAPKKRRAPAPPVPVANHEPHVPSIIVGHETKPATTHGSEHNSPSLLTTSSQDVTSGMSISSQQVSRNELINRLHSRNSSDSSGYHELTLSGCESPEAAYHNASKFKTSIDSTSIESAENANGDSGIQEPSSRISPIVEDQELQSKPLVNKNMDTLPSKKKRKAPAPPPPVPLTAAATPLSPTSSVTSVSSATSTPSVAQASSNSPVSLDTPVPPVTPVMAVSAPVTSSSQLVSAAVTVAESAAVTVAESAAETVAESTTESLVLGTHSESTTTNSVTSTTALTTTPLTTTSSVISIDSPQSQLTTDATDFISSPIAPAIKDDEEEKMIFHDKNLDDGDNSDVDINDTSAFDINEILAGVVFDEEPKNIDLRIAHSSMAPDGEKDEMMMMETASITSEDIEQIVVSSVTERPCAFIPPPPPTEPPPPVESDGDIPFSDYKKVLVDKGTELNEDNTSLAPSSAKSSPGMATSGYKNEMAMFVERMSKIAIANTLEPETPSTDDTVSLSIPGSDTNSETGSVIQHNRSDSKDSRSESEAGSLSRRGGQKMSGGYLPPDLDHEWHEVASPRFAMTEEITVPLESVPPPPDFDDERELSKNASEDEEEFYSETVEELIVPLGPNGYDFTAAVKVPVEEPVIEIKSRTQNENITGVFRAEPLSISSMSYLPTLVHHSQPKPATQPTQKEEFVLTTEDLSSVSFLPPKVRKAKPIPEPVPLVHISSKSIMIDKSLNANDVSKGKFELSGVVSGQHKDNQSRSSQSKTESNLRTHPLQNLPSMRISKVDAISSYSDDDQSHDPIVSRSTPRLLMNSNTAPHGSLNQKSSVDNVDGAYGRPYSGYQLPTESNTDSGGMKHSDSSSSLPSVDGQDQQEALQRQYLALQTQFSQWKEQLARNQNILASQTEGKDEQTDVRQLTAQMAKQQKMIDDIQSTMLAMQQQGQVKDLEVRSTQLPTPVSKPTSVSKQSIVTNKIPLKSTNAAVKPKPKPKFEPDLDPREELMIAIRNFNGREGLKTVPVNKTHWVQGNR